MPTYNPLLQSLSPFGLTKNEDKKEKLKSQGLCIYDFTLGDPLEPTPAFVKEALIKGLADISQYPLSIGSLSLRKSCAQWLKTRFSLDIDPHKNILSTNGSKEAVFHIPQVLFNANSEKRTVIFPEPGYPVYKSGTALAGGLPYVNALKPSHQYVFDQTDIPTSVLTQTAAAWVSYPHNPTGATISTQKMEDIYKWALDNDIILLSDECYVDMYFEGSAPPSTFLKNAAA